MPAVAARQMSARLHPYYEFCNTCGTTIWQLVAAAVYGGGTANGSGSQANVAGSISLAISEGDTGAITGNIYGGGDASKGGSAKAGSIHIALDDISGYFCEEMGDGGTQCYPSIWAGGCSDGAEGSKTGGDSTAVTLTSATAEHIWEEWRIPAIRKPSAVVPL